MSVWVLGCAGCLVGCLGDGTLGWVLGGGVGWWAGCLVVVGQ